MSKIVVLAEPWERLPESASVADIRRATETARLSGCRIFSIPPDFSQCTAEEALYDLHEMDAIGVWIGYVPTAERYKAVYDAALKKGVKLVNSPEQHSLAMEMDKYLPFIADLTPASVVVTSVDNLPDLEYPVFVKGSVQSRKARGWKACTANNLDELRERVRVLLQLETRTRGKVIIRKLVNLKHTHRTANDFPAGREYRIFIYNKSILAYGYYWDTQDTLNQSDKKEIERLGLEVANRIDVPYLAVDVGQLESGEWIVIEIGDASFAGFSKVEPLVLWNKLQASL